MGHEVWYAYGRFFKEAKDMERWTEFCEMGNEDDAIWVEVEGGYGGGGMDFGDGPDGRHGVDSSGAIGTTKRRRTISNGTNVVMTGMS